MSALHAAVRAGADAVYLGLESFNARPRGRQLHYRHAQGSVRLRASAGREDLCHAQHHRAAGRSGPRARMRSPSVARRCRCAHHPGYRSCERDSRALPDIRLHVSTQMNTCNAAGIRAAARMGAKRVTLARELSVEEIAHLAQVGARRRRSRRRSAMARCASAIPASASCPP